MRQLLANTLAGAFTSVIAVLLCAGFYALLERVGHPILFGGDKGFVLFPLFFGLPLGAITGIVLLEKFLYRTATWNLLGIVFGLVLSVVGSGLGLALLDALGWAAVPLVPLLVGLLCAAGYRLALHL